MKDEVFIGGRYEVLSKVGTGGMADVYKGKDHKLNRFVAIKILKKEYREDEMFVKKFQSEAQAAAGLMHPNIVNVYDVGEESGLYYMVMELVEGITLKDYINKKGVLSAKEVISIAIQVANGIEAAHLHNIVHRDIKPQNIIISKEGKVKVTDFGIAKATSSNTISTNALGSVHYSSPEQARGGFSDFKSDIYSLGITMYEMVTGHVPFDGDTAVSIAIKHLQEEITPPSEYVEDIPYSLEQIILKCTQKSPDRRYTDINALREDLKRSLADPDGDFVTIGSMRISDETVMFTPEDLGRIQREAKRSAKRYEEDQDEYDDEYDDYDDFEDDYDDDFDDEDDYRRKPRKKGKTGDLNPNMSKLLKILAIVAVVIIVFVMMFIVGKATGFLKFEPNAPVHGEVETDKKVKVPNLLGMTEEQARELLNSDEYNLGLSIDGSEPSEKYDEGQICIQEPAEGTEVKKNTTIKVVFSSKLIGKKGKIPSVAGMTVSEAREALKEEGFGVSRVEPEFSSTIAPDTVIKLNFKPGEKVPVETEIVIYFSKGENKPEVVDVTGKLQDVAKQILEDLDLKVQIEEVFSDTVEKGRVVEQSIQGGSRVAAGTTVVLKVSKGKEEKLVVVPDIIGKTITYAANQLAERGLIINQVPTPSEQEANTVISCEPGPGFSVKEGTTIIVYVSTGPETAPDPDPGW